MVHGKKSNDMSNGTTKYRDQQLSMSHQRKDNNVGGAGRNDGRSQNGNASSFRTDSAISGARSQGEGRTLQKWQPDSTADIDGSLESDSMRSSDGQPWDQFAEHERRFGVKTDYDENIYTTSIDFAHPQFKQRAADADRKAKEILSKTAFNSHVAEERKQDNVGGEESVDEEDKYSGVRRQQDFPPLSSSNTGNKYTPPARRPPTGQATVKGAPVDPAIISSQLARPDKSNADKSKDGPSLAAPKPDSATPPTTATSSFATATPEPKTTTSNNPSFSSRTASPNVRAEGAPNATATVEKDVTNAFKTFATQQRKNVDQLRSQKASKDKEIKLHDLKKFANSFKLHTPVPTDLVPIIAKDPAKQKEIQEKAKRNAEEAKANPSDAIKPIAPIATDARLTPRPVPATHGATSGNSPANTLNRQNTNRTQGFVHQGQFNAASFRQSQQPMPQHIRQPPGNLSSRLRNMDQTKPNQPLNPIPVMEARLPPTGPSHDANFSRRSSGVASAQGGRLNPNSTEFRPRPDAVSFNPNGNPSTGSSPRSATTLVDQPAPFAPPVKRSLLRRAPLPPSERPSIKDKFDALQHIKSMKPAQGKNWEATGGIRPAYDTAPTWRQLAQDEKPNSTMHLTYAKMYDMSPFPIPAMSSPNPTSAVPQVPHQHQLPFHLQQGVHNMGPRHSPRQPQVNIHGQHSHGPNVPFNGAEDHRMMPSHSAQSYSSPRLQNMPLAFQSPMGQPAQMAYNPQMMPYQGGGAPPIQQYRSLSQSHQFIPQPQMGPAIMMPNPANGFMTPQGMAPGPQMMYPPGQSHFMPNGPPAMPVNGFPSPGRGTAPMMMSQGSQQGHQQPIYGVNPGMSPGPQFGMVTPQFSQQQASGQMPMRGYNGSNQFGTSPQQMHQFGPQRNGHQNGNHNNKNFQQHAQNLNGQPNSQIPTGPQARADVTDESK